MGKSIGDLISKNAWKLGLLPLLPVIAAIEVVGDLAAGKTPKVKDVLGASGILDADGADGVATDVDGQE